jgi:hypothetical protein
MCEVYFWGSSNIIYLGESDDLTVEGIWTLECAIAEMASQIGGLSNIHRSMIDDHGREHHEVRVESPYSTEALHSIYRRKWFSRLWVIQEAFLSPVNNCICWGNTVPLHDLLAAALYVLRSHFIEEELIQPFYNAARLFYLIYRGYSDNLRRAHLQPTLASCLDMSGHFDVSVPADSVFAMLGQFADYIRLHNPEAWDLLRPDYTKPVGMVIADASRAAIVAFGEFDLFELIHHQHEQHVLAETAPSWAFDPRHNSNEPEASTLPFPRYHACKGLPAQKISHISSRILELKGLFLDDIVEAGPVSSAYTHGTMDTLWNFARGGAVVALCPSSPVASNSAFHTLSRTLVAGMTLSIQRVAMAVPRGATILLRSLQADFTDTALQIVEREYCTALIAACHMRRVFRTRDGLIGLGPAVARVGDTLTIQYNFECPSLLRPAARDHHHHFVGNCYVDGMMDGEASTRFGADSDRHRVFHLQ